MINANSQSGKDKPTLLRALEFILANPEEIKREALKLKEEFKKRYGATKSEEDIRDLTVKKIISKYSYYAAFAGGATGLTGVVPGIGTVVASFGGATADAALCMKYQAEMTMAIATVYGHEIETEEGKNIALVIAGLGAANEVIKEGSRQVGSKAFVKMAQQYLRGTTLQAVKQVFKMVGVTFSRKAIEKAIPFGFSAIVGFSSNKALTVYVGKKAVDFFSTAAVDVS